MRVTAGEIAREERLDLDYSLKLDDELEVGGEEGEKSRATEQQRG